MSVEFPKVTIIGGITQDIGGKSQHKLVAGDKNIGKTQFSFGGVAFNIARNLALVDVDLEFISAVGNDYLKENLSSELIKYPQINLSFYESKTNSSSTYLYILDSDSKMEVALSDFAVMDEFPVSFLEKNLNKNRDGVLVIDTNLSQECLEYLVKTWQGVIFCDPVSVAKSNKLIKENQPLEILSKIFLLKPNELEFQNLCQRLGLIDLPDSVDSSALSDFIITQDLVEQFLELTKIPYLVITQSDGPVIYATNLHKDKCEDSENFGIIEPNNPPATNPTGAGDAMMAGLVSGFLEQGLSEKYSDQEFSTRQNLSDWVKLGLAFSSLAIESDDIINDKISKEVISERIKKFQ